MMFIFDFVDETNSKNSNHMNNIATWYFVMLRHISISVLFDFFLGFFGFLWIFLDFAGFLGVAIIGKPLPCVLAAFPYRFLA